MIISKTPFRVSFFGGGTDYPEYFLRYGGAVLGTAIDKFAFLSAHSFRSRLFDYTIRLAYRQVECVSSIEEIEHAPFRECLRWTGISRDIELNYTAEVPSFSGLGTSSSFVVGVLNALYAFQGKAVRPLELAYEAIEIEREVLKEAVGCQDQTFAAVGGLNVLEFRTTKDIVVHRVPLSPERLQLLQDHLLMVFTGMRRRAHDIAAKQVARIGLNLERLKRMRAMVDKGYAILTGNGGLNRFGELLHEAWRLKSELDSSISNGTIREVYERGRSAGALGGKLLGAGGGGFILFFVPPERQAAVRAEFRDLEVLPLKVNAPGSHIIHN